jgi:hypothetical protein
MFFYFHTRTEIIIMVRVYLIIKASLTDHGEETTQNIYQPLLKIHAVTCFPALRAINYLELPQSFVMYPEFAEIHGCCFAQMAFHCQFAAFY